MTESEAVDAVRRAIAEVAPEIDPAALAEDVPLARQVDLDSMDMLAVLAAIEEITGIVVPERDVARLDTVAGAAAYLMARAGEGRP